MKTSISILFLFYSLTVHTQSRVFGDFDFTKNSWKLIVYHDDSNSSSSACFYINDKLKLQSLKDNWIGERTDTLYECGYDFYLYLIRSDSIVASFNVNTECGQVISKNGTLINFKGNPFQYLLKDGNGHRKHLFFSTLDSARITFDKYKQTKNVYIIDPDDQKWAKYDGWFIAKVDSGYNRNQIEAKIEKLSKAQVAENPVKILLDVYGPDLFILKVYSKKEYYLQFNLGNKDDWNSYDISYPGFDVIFTDDVKD